MSDDNYYEELGVEPGASRDELRDAYRQRVADLEAAREKKGVSDRSCRRTATRSRACARRGTCSPTRSSASATTRSSPAAEPDGDVELVDDDDGDAAGHRGASSPAGASCWRRRRRSSRRRGGATAAARTAPPPTRGRREPTIVLPDGMHLAEPQPRGMALLFDIVDPDRASSSASASSLPRLDPERLPGHPGPHQQGQRRSTTRARASSTTQKSADEAKTASDEKDAQSDLKDAEKRLQGAAKDAKDADVPAGPHADVTTQVARRLRRHASSDKIKTTSYIVDRAHVRARARCTSCRSRAITGRTLGMRGRKIKVVRVDGSPVGWYAVVHAASSSPIAARARDPDASALIAAVSASSAWGYCDPNGQGIHDKLARTIVVDA